MLENKMTRTTDWIGANCSKGESFAPLARRAMASHIGEVFYVDLSSTGKGADAGDGDNWDRPYLTINHALDQVTAYDNDYILVKGWKTETATGVIATLDVAGCHVIGQPILMNPYYPEKGTLYRSGAGDAPHTNITAEFVEFAGFAMNAVQSSGSEGPSVTKGYLLIGTTATGGGNKCFVHNIHMTDWNVAANVTGMDIRGAHYPVVRDLIVDNIYGNFDTGLYIGGSGTSNSAYGTLEDLYMQGGVAGAFTQAIKLYAASCLQNSRINGLVVQRCTNAINLGGAYGGYCSIDNSTAGCVENSFFAGTSACDARNDLWTNYKWIVGENVSGYDAQFADS